MSKAESENIYDEYGNVTLYDVKLYDEYDANAELSNRDKSANSNLDNKKIIKKKWCILFVILFFSTGALVGSLSMYLMPQKDAPITTTAATTSSTTTRLSLLKRGFLNKYAYVVKLDNLSVVRRPKKCLKSMKSCKIYVKLSIISRNPKENLIYLNISDCSPDEMQSLINIVRILMILKLYLNKNFHVTE